MLTTEGPLIRFRRALGLAVSALMLLGSLVLVSGCYVRGPRTNRTYHQDNRRHDRGHHDNGRHRGRGHGDRDDATVHVRVR